MAAAISPVYSIYADMRNGYSVGIHKLRLRADQLALTTAETYTWNVPILAPGSSPGAQLSLAGQFPNLAQVTASTDRRTANVFIGASSSAKTTYPRNPDGSVDLIYATIHSGSVNS